MRCSRSFRREGGGSLPICIAMWISRASSSARLRNCFTWTQKRAAIYTCFTWMKWTRTQKSTLAYLHGHESQEVSDKGVKSPSVEFLLAEAFTCQNAFGQEEEDSSQNGLISQCFVCLSELYKGWGVAGPRFVMWYKYHQNEQQYRKQRGRYTEKFTSLFFLKYWMKAVKHVNAF